MKLLEFLQNEKESLQGYVIVKNGKEITSAYTCKDLLKYLNHDIICDLDFKITFDDYECLYVNCKQIKYIHVEI